MAIQSQISVSQEDVKTPESLERILRQIAVAIEQLKQALNDIKTANNLK